MKLLPANRMPQPARRAFTLIELLVVISIIAVLAAFILPLAGSVNRVKKIDTAQAELQKIETMLENYKAKTGTYPPSSGNLVVTNALFYELSGVTNDGTYYRPLDGSLPTLITDFKNRSGLGGVVNSTKGGGDETVYAKDFLPDLKANQFVSSTNTPGGSPYYYLVTSVGGPDASYQPLSGTSGNPFRYLYPGVNNPSSYDLWVQLSINSTPTSPHFYLICNWSQQTIRNSPLP
jgi:prepilin-type N-terminal cleavage/methylation domain-containing protein